MQTRAVAVIGWLCLLAHCPGAVADTVALSPEADNTLYEAATGSISNGAGEHFFAGTTSQGQLRRGLVRFDVAGGIPQGSMIVSATLRLYMSRTLVATGQIVRLHRVTSAWGEGSSDALANEGSGAPATAGDATWIHTFWNTDFWISAGGDFDGVASAATTVTGLGVYQWSSDAMRADVQQWLDNPAANFGWLVAGNESSPSTTKRFDSRENALATNRPVLVIEYEQPVATEEKTWGAIKSLYEPKGLE